MSEQAPGIGERFEAILRSYVHREEMAAACELVAREGLEPLLEAWRRSYARVPPELAAHLQAHAEFSVITDMIRVLKSVASQIGPARHTADEMVAAALGQLQAEMGSGDQELQGDVE